MFQLIIITLFYAVGTISSYAGVTNQSKTKSYISYCITAKNHIIHMGTHEHHHISSSPTHIPLLS